ncbi:hypothetical protein FI667_g8042, partial [Globisporangium splendens]
MAGGPTRSASGAPWAIGARARITATPTYTSSSASHKAQEEQEDEAQRGGSVLSEESSALAKAADEYEADYDDGDELMGENDGDDGWEDVDDDAPAFRDASFLDDDADSEYAPSDHEDREGENEWSDAELSPTELVGEEEETTVAGLFANMVRQFGGGKKAKRMSQRPGKIQDPNDNGDASFDEQDAMHWGNETEKQQWIERYEAANKQFVHRYGCRIDSPAHPDAKARLRREKKKKSVYSLVLFALAAAYLVQLVAMSTSLPSASLPLSYVSSASETLTMYVSQLPRSSDVYHSLLEKFSRLDAHSNISTEEATPSKAPEDASEQINDTGADAATDSTESQKNSVTTAEEVVIDVNVDVQTTEVHESVSSPAVGETQRQEKYDADSEISLREKVVDQPDDGLSKREEETARLASEVDSIESTESAVDTISEYSKVAVQLCSKFLYKLVKSKHDETMKEAATRACDAAVSMASRESVEWVEARVLRGDLWSLVSEFDAADGDYSAAATSPVLNKSADSTLSESIQLKVVSNRWIKMFTQKSYKELYHECDQVAKAEQSSTLLRSLAADWVLVFKKKKQALDVLTRSRSWTLQRLEYA